MRPNSSYSPTSLQELAAWMQNFSTQFALVAVTPLGFLAADVAAVENDNADFQFLANFTVELEAYKDAARQYRIITTEGDIGDPKPVFPAAPVGVPPNQVLPGLFERLDKLVKRIRTMPNYTSEIGALLGIIPTKPTPIAPDQMQPELKISSLPGSIVQVSFVRGKTDGVVLEMKIDNAATWSDAGKFIKSPVQITIPQNAQTLPRSVQLRARYVDGNDRVGQFSPVVTTATQPEG